MPESLFKTHVIDGPFTPDKVEGAMILIYLSHIGTKGMDSLGTSGRFGPDHQLIQRRLMSVHCRDVTSGIPGQTKGLSPVAAAEVEYAPPGLFDEVRDQG